MGGIGSTIGELGGQAKEAKGHCYHSGNWYHFRVSDRWYHRRGITVRVAPVSPGYHRDTQVIPNFLDFKNWYHRWAGITTPYHVFYIEYDNYGVLCSSAEYSEYAQNNVDTRLHV